MQAGKPIPPSGYVARYERFVWIDPYYELVGPFNIGTNNSRNIPRWEEINDITYPIRLFRINVYGTGGQAEPWWIGICFNYPNGSIPSCNAERDRIQVDFGSGIDQNPFFDKPLEIGSYDLTKVINNMLKMKGFKIGDKVLVKCGIKNTDATLDFSDSVTLIAGKAAAKIVIHVW